MIKHVMFDMDGLLIDSERCMWIPNEIKSFKSFNIEADMPFLYSLMGSSRKVNSMKFLERYGQDFPIDEYYDRVYEYNKVSVANGEIPLKKGARELIQFLKENDISFSLGTSSQKDYARKVLTSNNVYDDFKIIVTVDDTNVSKPEPDIYLKCLQKANVKAEYGLVLEDAHNGALAAIAAGCKCIIIPDLGTLYDWDRQHCTFADSLLEVIDYIKKENGLE